MCANSSNISSLLRMQLLLLKLLTYYFNLLQRKKRGYTYNLYRACPRIFTDYEA